MAKIRIDSAETLIDGMDIKFKAPCDCTEVTGLIVYYPAEDDTIKTKELTFRDAHGNDLTGVGNLFSKDAYVKVIADAVNGYAYPQNADNNGYLNSAIFGTYTHDAENLIGSGENGKFKATVSGTISSINVNGVSCSVKCGEDTSMDLVAGCWYTFILDGNTVNFNSGGGGAGAGGTLTVTAPAGVTVSVSKDGKVKTKTSNAEGLAVFKGLKTGTWQLTITDGSQVSTKPVVITADYSTVIAFFMATISITYPEGSICTCSDGVTTLTAPDTSGTWECIVPNTGTWTVSITNGEDTAEDTVEITTDGQSEILELSYWNGELYKYGNEYTELTGGWYISWRSGQGGMAVKETSSFKSTSGDNTLCKSMFSANNPIDLSSINKITAVFSKVDALKTAYPDEYGHAIGLRSSKLPEGELPGGVYKVTQTYDMAYTVNTKMETATHSIELDVSGLSGQAYLTVWFGCISCECYEVFYE